MAAMTADTDETAADAPGHPGLAPTWTSSAKDIVGCSLGASRVWFTLGFGIVNEVYYPRIDIPQIRDLGFIVADGQGFWAEVKRVADYELRLVVPGVPAVEVRHRHERYELRLRLAPDPRRDVLVIETELTGGEDLALYVLLAPHLGATGHGNSAGVARHRGRTVLWAEQGPFGTALAAADATQRDAMRRGSAGYVGTSDGWQDFARNGAMRWDYLRAGPGNVALIGELPHHAVLALGFGTSREAATTLAVSSLLQPFDNLLQQHIAHWETWQAGCSERSAPPLGVPDLLRDQFLVSRAVLRTHLDKTYPGAMVASLSVPWGDTGEERGGYHLAWPRDMVQCATALLAMGAEREARDALRYLIATQQEDGHWYQNQWLGGKPYWTGIQLDETAFPVLLAAALDERQALGGIAVADMVRRALGFIAGRGPATDQDRWEENAGINPFTLAVAIAALVAGSAFLAGPARRWALDLADFWNANVERWCVVRDGPYAKQYGLRGYYLRTAPHDVMLRRDTAGEPIALSNQEAGRTLPANAEISTDFLQLVRFGLRRPNDPILRDSVALVDRLLKAETPAGAAWRRYNRDGYGEHDDGRPFDGSGRGRLWPLLAGERGHYELVAGRDPLPQLEAMARMASPGGMIPEQVWDGPAIPARRLALGRPTGSAMPLAWAHAEFVKLLLSRHAGAPVDRPRAVWQRYKGRPRAAGKAFWWPHAPIGDMRAGARLAVCTPLPAIIRWSTDGWRDVIETATQDSGLGFSATLLDTAALPPGGAVDFTLRWAADGTSIGKDFRVGVAE